MSEKSNINVKVIEEKSLKTSNKKPAKADVNVVLCLRGDKKSSHPNFKPSQSVQKKDDFVVIQPKASKDSLEKIQEAVSEGVFSAKDGQVLILRSCGVEVKHTLVIGLGKIEGFDSPQNKQPNQSFEAFRRCGAAAFKALDGMKAHQARLHLHHLDLFSGKAMESSLQAFLEGFFLASYQFEEHFSKDKKSNPTLHTLELISGKFKKSVLEDVASRVIQVNEGIAFTRWLADQPGNIITPVTLAKEVQKKFKGSGVKVTVWDEARIQKENMGLLYGVGQGSAVESRLMIMEYKSKHLKKKVAPICFVGKGITFDSGGISIKPSKSMEEMKYDMCGAATVIGTMLALERLKANVHVIGIVASAENMPGSKATKPGDIHYARNGLSVEVFNTDAEGRLALGDALCLATEKKPKFIVDAATLTGAVVIALGHYHTGYFVQGEDLAKDIEGALQATQENAWRLPLGEEHRKAMKGIHADLKNIGDGDHPGAGSTKGAAFLSYFVGESIPWTHFDIAGTAYNVGHLYPYCPKKGASGLMVRTFCQLAIDSFKA